MAPLKNSTKAWLAFACVAFFWGTTYLAIRIGVKNGFPPLSFGGLRHLSAGFLIVGYFVLVKGYKMPPLGQLKHAFVMALLMLGIGNGLLVWAQQYISSGLAAIISSTFPFAVFMFSWMGGQDKLNLKVGLGLLLGFTGQLIIFNDRVAEMANPAYLWGIIALFVAVLVWGYGAVYRKTAVITMNSLYFSGWQMILGGLMYIPFILARGEVYELQYIQEKAIWAFLYLIVFGSIIAYGSFMYVLDKLPATVVSMYSHINTIVAVLLGWIVLYEPLNIEIAISTVFTIAGVYLVNLGLKKAKAA